MIMENVDDLYENRMKICKECPLYLDSPMGARCNSRLYLSEADKKTVSDRPKLDIKEVVTACYRENYVCPLQNVL